MEATNRYDFVLFAADESGSHGIHMLKNHAQPWGDDEFGDGTFPLELNEPLKWMEPQLHTKSKGLWECSEQSPCEEADRVPASQRESNK